MTRDEIVNLQMLARFYDAILRCRGLNEKEMEKYSKVLELLRSVKGE